MPNETITTFVDMLRDQKGPLAKQLDRSTVLLSELKKDMSPENYDGEYFRMGVILSLVQGTGFVSEEGTLNVPRVLDKTKTQIQAGIVTVPISFSTKVMEASNNREQAWLDAVDDKMTLAEEAFRDVINESFNAAGDALVAATTATNSNSTTVTVGTAANWYQLYEGRVGDFKRRSDGVDVATANGSGGTGLGRKIVSVDETLGTMVVDLAISTTANDGFYVEGSYGNGIAGFGQIAGTTGSFQQISRTTYPQWKGTDASPAVANSDLTIARFDAAERKARRRSGSSPDLWWGDPAVLDNFSQGLTTQAVWAGNDGKLETGWTGVAYRNHVLVPEFAAPSQTLFGTLKRDIRILTLDNGPDWDEKDGSFFKRFSRALPLEAWLVWMLNLGVKRCNSTVKIGSLKQAIS